MKDIKSLIKPIERAIRVVDKADPFQKKIDKNDVSDTGMESVRLADQSVRTVAKVTVNVFKVAESVWNHAAAAMLNPVIWVILLLAFMTVLLGAVVVIIIDGGAASTQTAYVSAAGLGIVEDEYRHGQELFRAAEQAKRNDFNAMIRAAYYSSHLPYCDLMYMEKTHPDGLGGRDTSIYNVGFATDEYKAVMESAWNLFVNEPQAIAIAYVYLQKQVNEEKQTEMDIYDVQYTEEVFAEILNKCVTYSDATTNNVECPSGVCDLKQEKVSYYDWDNNRWDYYNKWVSYCPHFHTLHRFGLAFFTKEDVMNALGFTNKEKEWAALTEEYFKTLTP